MTSVSTLALLALPSPLHPAVIHFPIVLILLGSLAALIALFTRRWSMPAIAAILLGLGAIGTIAAVQTGEQDADHIKETSAIEATLEEHEVWAERTQAVALAATVLAIGALATSRWPGPSRALSVVTAVAGLVATGCVIRAAHFGGELVYRHGAGINLSQAGGPAVTQSPGEISKSGRNGEKDED